MLQLEAQARPRDPTLDRARLNLQWVLRIRSAAIVAQVAVVAVAVLLLQVRLSVVAVAAVTLVEAALNLAVWRWSRSAAVTERHVALYLGVSVALFTALLGTAGGAHNPFGSLFIVHVAVAALVVRPAAGWTIASAALVGYGLLYWVHLPLDLRGAAELLPQALSPARHHGAGHGAASHHGDGEAAMLAHLYGMWLALGVASALVMAFNHRLSAALADLDRQLASVREREARSAQLASLATLAAGAAHELATPLSTIAVVARELERRLADAPEAVLEDVGLISSEVHRCRRILDRMAADAGHSAGEGLTELSAGDLARRAIEDLPKGVRVVVEVDDDVAARPVLVPLEATSQSLRSLIRNACDADPERPATLRVRRPTGATATDDGSVELVVIDHGPGMTEEVRQRAIEPFFTTKGPGRGMGLGLFLAHSVAVRMGGSLEIESSPGAGTSARFVVPSPPATRRRMSEMGLHSAPLGGQFDRDGSTSGRGRPSNDSRRG